MSTTINTDPNTMKTQMGKYEDIVFDISHKNTYVKSHNETYQAAAQAGFKLIIHKGLGGQTVQDQDYFKAKTAAKGAGLLWGAYEFGYVEKSQDVNGEEQAKKFCDYISGPDRDGLKDTLLILDLEDPKKTIMTLGEVQKFVEYINNRTGRYPGLYSRTNLLDPLTKGGDEILSKCWLWLAAYPGENPKENHLNPAIPKGWDDYTLWQYTDSGRVPDFKGKVDRSYYNSAFTQKDIQTFFNENKPTKGF